MPAYYGIGIRAFTSSVANVSSKVAWQLHETASRGDAAALQALMSTYVVPLYVLRAKRRGYEVSVMKSLMDLLGLAGGPVRPPLANLRPEEVESLRASVPAWKTVDLIGSRLSALGSGKSARAPSRLTATAELLEPEPLEP